MDQIPMEWIDRIFEIMNEHFGERWTQSFNFPNDIDRYKTLWKNGLTGLTKDEIRRGLLLSNRMAKNNQLPPHVIEFFHYSKGTRVPPNPPKVIKFHPNRVLADNSINVMKTNLTGKTATTI